MNVGITGGKGFIGSHIAEALKKNPRTRVFLFDRPKGDVLNKRSFSRFVKGKDVIIHAAAINRGTDEEIVRGSVEGTLNLISAASSLKKKPKIIFISSIHVEMGTIYGASKKLCEMLLESVSNAEKIPVSVFRLTNVFGEGCRPFYNSVVATLSYQVAHGKKPTIHDTSRKLHLVYVDDVAKMIVNEVNKKRKSPFYFKRIGGTKKISVGNLVKTLIRFKKEKYTSRERFERDLLKTFRSYYTDKKI